MKEYSYVKRALLRELSENSRIPVTALAKKMKCSRNTIVNNIKYLEREFDLHYTLEFNTEMLFIQSHIWCIKFGRKPKTKYLKELLEEEGTVQFAARTSGDFDLIMNIAAYSGEKYMRSAIKIIIGLLDYKPVVEPSLISMVHTGFMPLQDSTIKDLKQNARLESFDPLDRNILVILNENSRTTYKKIAKMLKEDVETIRYRIRALSDAGIIRRFTIVLKKPPTDYNIVFLMNYKFSPGIIERYEKARNYYIGFEENLNAVNKFQYLSLMSGSYTLFGMGCFENEETGIKEAVMEHKKIYSQDNPTVSFAKITEVVKGYNPIRSIYLKDDYKPIEWK
ncbi:MAG: AsnC family transcriptional regulator [Candidatus Micrarchaeota archaeon]|nr:AsnC family transcriptional regulator [Candidatus Micrarchaeota archaeon]